MSEQAATCPRCRGAGIVETCDAVMALAYSIGLIRQLPKPTGTVPCPDCIKSSDHEGRHEHRSR